MVLQPDISTQETGRLLSQEASLGYIYVVSAVQPEPHSKTLFSKSQKTEK